MVAAVGRTTPEAGTRVVLNPSPPAPVPGDVLAACDPLVVNAHEARVLLRDHPAGAAARAEDWAEALLARGPRSVVVTLGPEGALLARASGTVRVPALPVEAVDTTGAGDAFTGALAWRLGVGDDLETAVRYAVQVGAAAVTRPGAQQSFPTGSEVTELCRNLPRNDDLPANADAGPRAGGNTAGPRPPGGNTGQGNHGPAEGGPG
ncbi:PfkB family carbohydrate kinase, partial [Streptomyces sp. 8N706]|uniref:PfkB family carbohydrate kinase n=1 Tax=Streptomyces sp. 8N706 TaxID=3457416 RepID=UPI003FD1143D